MHSSHLYWNAKGSIGAKGGVTQEMNHCVKSAT